MLATYDAPLLGPLLDGLHAQAAVPTAIILDSVQMSEKDRRFHDERTGGRLPWRPLHDVAAGIPVYFVESHKDETTRNLVALLALDFMVNCGTPRILDAPILSSTSLGVLNCHPGRLPDYRGCNCPEWAVLNDDPVCNTVHRMSIGIDEGPVLLIEPASFSRPCRYQDMRVAVYQQGMHLLARAARGLQEGRLGAADFVAQAEGVYRKPLDRAAMDEVVRKLEQGSYTPK
ncbi:MAG: formyltransferase family protein [Vicinamibacterales bacterium]